MPVFDMSVLSRLNLERIIYFTFRLKKEDRKPRILDMV